MTQTECCRIDWEPLGIRSEAEPGTSIAQAARAAGVQLALFCGGNGTCGSCRVIVREGICSPRTATEKSILTAAELDAGMRLACQTEIRGNIKLQIPLTSLSSKQRLQLEGAGVSDIQDRKSSVRIFDLTVKEPDIKDLRSDGVRLRQALEEASGEPVRIAPELLHSLSDVLRAGHWKVCAVLQGNTLTALLPFEADVFGLAVDIGTTKIAAYLVDLRKRVCAARTGTMNPQISYGEDVVSRISYTESVPDGRNELRSVLIGALNELIGELCGEAKCSPDQITDAVIVCNTAIHHFFAGFPVRQLGMYPFVPAESAPICFPASYFGLKLSPGASVYMPGNIAGYVGADHVSMLVGISAHRPGTNRVAVDVGTNTEISVFTRDGRSFCCSCASGPTFEGAHIRNGMRAASGAIEKAAFDGKEIHWRTIEDQPPAGICGSGILDLVYALKSAGAVSDIGKFDPEFPGVEPFERNYAYHVTGNIYVTRSDINEIILAKSAIRTGIEILLSEAGLKAEDISLFTVAGAFGTYLDLNSAVGIGMFPDIPMDRFEQVGNAAGSGAQRMLLSASERVRGEKLAAENRYVELTSHPMFKKVYVSAMNLKKGKLGRI